MATRDDGRCHACGGEDLHAFHAEDSIPTNSCLLLEDRAEAEEYPHGQLTLAICAGCGFIANTSFDPALAEYSARYEETQSFSPHFNEFARSLAKRWVDTYDLHGRSVLEIGCGKGEFLVLMCEAGVGHGIGIDPGTHPERIDSPAGARIEWITDKYSPAYSHLQADAVVCRHTLEHIQPVGEFMRTIREGIGDRSDVVVLFELPDVLRVLREAAFWDVYYEHCSYFSAGSLARLFESTGFEVLDVHLDYDDQYLILEARPAGSARLPAVSPRPHSGDDGRRTDVRALLAAASTFSEARRREIEGWRNRLQDLVGQGGRAFIWGAGSKGVAYLNALGPGLVEAAVDINPHKHGKHMAGTGHRIVAPEELVVDPPDLVIVMNAVYLDEVRVQLAQLDLHPEVLSV